MSYIKDIALLIFKIILGIGALAAAILACLKIIKPLMKKRLNKKEKEILAKAVEGNCEICKISVHGSEWISIKNKNYPEDDDKYESIRYIEALEKLIIHGCVRHKYNGVFGVTDKGSEIGEKYKKKWSKK